MSNEKKEIKVTDKRMFTAEGELREEYRFLHEKATSAAMVAGEPAAPPPPAPRQAEPEPPPRDDFSALPPELGGPSFFDLVAMVAEPIPIYLGEARLPDGRSAADPEMARFHIGLLDVVRRKTLGNLTAQESAFLEDLLSQLRHVPKPRR